MSTYHRVHSTITQTDDLTDSSIERVIFAATFQRTHTAVSPNIPEPVKGTHISSPLSSISGIMTARFILHLREWDHKVTTASEGSVMEPIEFQQPSPESEGSEQDHEDESEYVNEREREHERSRSRSGSGSIIDEFGRCPVRQARIERKLSIQNDIEEV